MRPTTICGNLIASGAYLRPIREARGSSRAAVAGARSTNAGNIVTIEAGTIDTTASTWCARVMVLAATSAEIVAVMVDHTVTVVAARARAHAWLATHEPGANPLNRRS